jgi:protein TonB
MIRRKVPQADLKRSYRKVLWFSVGLSGLLHLGLFLVAPPVEFRPRSPVAQPVVIELERLPQTRQKLPLPPPLALVVAEKATPEVRVRPRLQARAARAEFPLEEEEEPAELWMVEKKPTVLRQVVPEYPDSARRALVEGRVTVRVLVDRQGRVERVDRIEGPLVFHRAAAEAARQWEFAPAVQNEQTVRVWVSLAFVFELE